MKRPPASALPRQPRIPADHPVQPLLTAGAVAAAEDPARCGTCGLYWDDGEVTSITPTPSARCPFEYFHDPEE